MKQITFQLTGETLAIFKSTCGVLAVGIAERNGRVWTLWALPWTLWYEPSHDLVDSLYDDRGVNCSVRIVSGQLKEGDRIAIVSGNAY